MIEVLMERSNKQLEMNVAASFGYVKKDVLMLNDSYTKIQETISILADNYKQLKEEVKRLKEKKSTPKKAVSKPKVVKKVASKPKVTKKAVSKPKTKRKDDLTTIEGVGPVLEGILQKNKLLTYKSLSKKTGEQLKKILDKEGTKYQMHDPSTWPKQARLASEGKFKELRKYQDTLNKNKGTSSKVSVKKISPKKVTSKKVSTTAPKGVKKIVEKVTTYE